MFRHRIADTTFNIHNVSHTRENKGVDKSVHGPHCDKKADALILNLDRDSFPQMYSGSRSELKVKPFLGGCTEEHAVRPGTVTPTTGHRPLPTQGVVFYEV